MAGWKMDHLSVIFLLKTSIQFGDFPASIVWWNQRVHPFTISVSYRSWWMKIPLLAIYPRPEHSFIMSMMCIPRCASLDPWFRTYTTPILLHGHLTGNMWLVNISEHAYDSRYATPEKKDRTRTPRWVNRSCLPDSYIHSWNVVQTDAGDTVSQIDH